MSEKYLRVAFLTIAAMIANGAFGADPAIQRVLPPPGIKIADADREKIAIALGEFEHELAAAKWPVDGADAQSFRSDIEIYHKAVRYALDLDEFYSPGQVGDALKLIQTGRERLKELLARNGKPSWSTASGLVVRGYKSKLDDSVQPYGLVIPEKLDLTKPVPLYVWLHGRNEKGTDLAFITEQEKSKGQILPDDAIVLRVFGRHCNAFKFAGEVDVFEAMASVKGRYKIDDRRIVLIGFSMGGAGCWHLAAHYPGVWAAACPGAGFVDTKRYQNLSGDKLPTWYEQKLWGLYDVPDYARNLFNYPVIAYSGELDKQKASADIMDEVFKSQDHKLERIIGPNVEHKYEANALKEIHKRLEEIAAKGQEKRPSEISFETRTLRYNRCYWLDVEQLTEHWADARVDASAHDQTVKLVTRNVSRLSLGNPFNDTSTAKSNSTAGSEIQIDGTKLHDVTWKEGVRDTFTIEKRKDGIWYFGKWVSDLEKTSGLQGPIDDAFMDRFLVVAPSGKAVNEKIQSWSDFERMHFQDRWRRLFRGEARIKKDSDVNETDIAENNLILWGDANSNRLIAKIAQKLPIKWNDKTLEIAGQTYSADTHVPVLIYPNPLNPTKYIVINSGITFREGHDHTNAQQTPKLPDWAVIDITQPPDDKTPGKIVAADFFDEQWQVKKK